MQSLPRTAARHNSALPAGLYARLRDLLARGRAGTLDAEPGVLAVTFALLADRLDGTDRRAALELVEWYDEEAAGDELEARYTLAGEGGRR